MELFQPEKYGEQISQLIIPEKVNSLGPGLADMKYLRQLENLDPNSIFSPLQIKNDDIHVPVYQHSGCITIFLINHIP